MAYTIQAVIAEEKVVRKAAPHGVSFVPLPQGMALVPITNSVQSQYGIDFLPFTYDGCEELPAEITSFVAPFAMFGKVAYIEAVSHGGPVEQANVVWEDGHPLELELAPYAINQALKQLGVNAESDSDEFDAVDLGRYRFTDNWTKDKLAEQAP